MIKKNPRYKITVYSWDNTITVEYPLTCKVNISRGTFSQSNRANIQIYNIAPSKRALIRQDVFIGIEPAKQKYVTVEAGYETQEALSLIFSGRILQAYSYKSGGQTDVITEIQAQALDIFNAQSSYLFEAGTSFKDAYKTLATDLKNVKIGNTGNINGEFKTATTFDGNTFDLMNTLTGGQTFLDNSTLNTLMANECIDVPVPVISDTTGLLETPRRRDVNLEVKMLFEPTLLVGQLLEINSRTEPDFNGQYKVIGFTHDCLFSETQAGQRITTANLLIGDLLPSSDIALTSEEVIGSATQPRFNKVKGEEISAVALNEPAEIQGVYRYIKANNGAIPNTKITNNISWQEMLGNNNTNTERLSELTIGKLTNVFNTAQNLQKFIDTYYRGKKINITSGWRSTRNNKSCGGKPTSKHLQGLAVDFNVSGVTVTNLFKKLKGFWSGYIQEYRGDGFVHAQLNTGRGRVNDV